MLGGKFRLINCNNFLVVSRENKILTISGNIRKSPALLDDPVRRDTEREYRLLYPFREGLRPGPGNPVPRWGRKLEENRRKSRDGEYRPEVPYQVQVHQRIWSFDEDLSDSVRAR